MNLFSQISREEAQEPILQIHVSRERRLQRQEEGEQERKREEGSEQIQIQILRLVIKQFLMRPSHLGETSHEYVVIFCTTLIFNLQDILFVFYSIHTITLQLRFLK